MEVKEKLASYKKELDVELAKYLEQKRGEAAKISPHAKELIDHITDLTLRGGKRIRAALLFYSYLAHGGKNRPEAIRASCAMEMAETYLLIHDDIMDNGLLRRGGLTVNEIYRQIGESKFHDKINTRNFGNSIAMLGGNIAAALSCEVITQTKFHPENIRRALCELSRVYVAEQYGQMLDMLSEIRDDIKVADVLLVHQFKTAPYTFEGPVKIGALLAGAKDKYVERLSDYALPLGVAFQIQDDILGMFGSEEKLGKSVTSDLKEGKKTTLILEALARATPAQREIIEINLGNNRTTINALKQVREIIEKTGSLEKSKKMAEKLVRQAIDSLTKLRLKEEGKSFLVDIADYMIKREY
ncbi:MAG: polyprenyl synthetase family protein [Patescibacteria group bacterium]